MVGKVGVIQSEYSSYATTIKDLHSSNIEQVNGILDQLAQICAAGGPFETKHVGRNVENMIIEIRDVLQRIDSVYSSHESIVKNFQDAVDNYDTLC